MTGKPRSDRLKASKSLVAGADDVRYVSVVFTDEQIAFLDERVRLASQTKPMQRIGGSNLRRSRESLFST